MAFPKLNAMSYWIYFIGGVIMMSSFFLPGGAAQSGWTSYPPLADIAPSGQTAWLLSMTFVITSSLFGSINFIVTTINLRAPGLTWMRLPIFVWAQFVTAILLVFAFPVLQSGAILQLLDRVAGTSFICRRAWSLRARRCRAWRRQRAAVSTFVLVSRTPGSVCSDSSGDGHRRRNYRQNTRKPLFGYKTLVGSLLFLGGLSFVVWAHHMFLSGMKTSLSRISW